jgi:hypothetical protein
VSSSFRPLSYSCLCRTKRLTSGEGCAVGFADETSDGTLDETELPGRLVVGATDADGSKLCLFVGKLEGLPEEDGAGDGISVTIVGLLVGLEEEDGAIDGVSVVFLTWSVSTLDSDRTNGSQT